MRGSDATKGAATDAAGSHELTDGSKSLLLLLLLVRSLRMLEELAGDASRLDGTRWDPRLAGRDHVCIDGGGGNIADMANAEATTGRAQTHN